jgi:hypothetical protein
VCPEPHRDWDHS